MKKLLLASIIMIGVSSVASAQTPEAVKAKKEAAKVNAGTPAITNAAQQTSAATVPTTQAVTTEKVDGAPTAKQIEVKKAKAAAQPKTVAPVRKSVKTN